MAANSIPNQQGRQNEDRLRGDGEIPLEESEGENKRQEDG